MENWDAPGLTSFFDHSGTDLLGVADSDGNWLKVSRSWTAVLGWSEQEVLDSRFPEFVHPDDVTPTVETHRQVRREALEVARFDNRYRCRDGSYQWLRWTGTSDAETGLIYAIAHPVSVDELRLARQEIDAGTVDAIMSMVGTGIVTTDLRGTITSFSSGAELMFGHPAARMIGQPVSMLMPEAFHSLHAEMMQRYREGQAHRIVRKGALQVTARAADGTGFPVGITLNDVDSTPAKVVAVIQDLRPIHASSASPGEAAPTTAPAATGASKATVDIPNQQIPEGTSALRRRLLSALQRGEFLAHYQPIVDGQGSFMGMEALLRWQPPDQPVRSAFEFIDEAEQSGLIVELGRVTVDAAVRDTAALLRDGLWPDQAVCTVNLSPQQLSHPQIVEEIRRCLRQHDVPAGVIGLEITESSVLDPAALKHIAELHDLGCPILLDDFGTGYANLHYLHKFPLDAIKLDRSFVQGVASNPVDAAIISSQISLASLLDVMIIAEGVEHPHQLDSLHRRGCRNFQGFLFARPASIGAIRQYRRPGAGHAPVREPSHEMPQNVSPN